jgi:hypothetical protein
LTNEFLNRLTGHSSILSQTSTHSPAASKEIFPSIEFIQPDLNKSPFQKTSIQFKLAIGTPDDPLEQEADAMADTIMRMPEQNFIQRKCANCEEEEKVQRKPLASFIQRKESSAGTVASDAVSNKINASRGNGSTMDSHTQSFMQSRFGADFSDVKIHTGGEAIQMNRELNAKAFTVGNDIFFNEGQYDPGSNQGKHLLAHELTHTVQQGNNIKSKIQRLTALSNGPINTGTCGNYSKQWIFELSSPAAEDGYIVQQVDMYEEILDCPLTARCLARPTFTFWEAWWLKKGDTRQHIHSSVGFTDQASLRSNPGKSGSHSAVGTIKFFKKSVTGDLGREGVVSSDPNISWRPGNNGGVRLSGWLPSTTTIPTWWNNSMEGPVNRYANSDWSCCGSDGQRHWSISTANP